MPQGRFGSQAERFQFRRHRLGIRLIGKHVALATEKRPPTGSMTQDDIASPSSSPDVDRDKATDDLQTDGPFFAASTVAWPRGPAMVNDWDDAIEGVADGVGGQGDGARP
jgi:hypothetical protein